MKKVMFLVMSLLMWWGAVNSVSAKEAFDIKSFKTEVVINQDTSIDISERILVDFSERRHGIYRLIPDKYKVDSKKINSNLKVSGVYDGDGKKLKYAVSHKGDYVEIKIGDADRYVNGEQVYVIEYKVHNILQEYDDHWEFYWNVTGSDWDTEIMLSSVVLNSDYAEILKVNCFAGLAGSSEQKCEASQNSGNDAYFSILEPVGYNKDFTIVIALDKNNNLILPGATAKFTDFIYNNWGYLVAMLPFVYMGSAWFRKGRDKRYLSDNVFYTPTKKDEKTVGLFKRAHLPMAYSPIDGITPGELGTIVDERVDSRDVTAEIVELARLKFLRIEVIKKKQIIGSKVDYRFTKLNRDGSELRDYQLYLLDKLFGEKTVVNLSDLENKFYKYLGEFKKKIYNQVDAQGYFNGNPDKVRINWIIRWVLLEVFSGVLMARFVQMTGNIVPLIIFIALSMVGFVFSFLMPRKTAKGYSIHRQGKGLAFYVSKGKWRHEVVEKNLFFEEMLPLAISLGVVKKLAKDMEKLGVKPPSYVQGVNSAFIYSNLSGIGESVSKSIASSPSSSGSGFSGGSSGGGFGGGGGGSW